MFIWALLYFCELLFTWVLCLCLPLLEAANSTPTPSPKSPMPISSERVTSKARGGYLVLTSHRQESRIMWPVVLQLQQSGVSYTGQAVGLLLSQQTCKLCTSSWKFVSVCGDWGPDEIQGNSIDMRIKWKRWFCTELDSESIWTNHGVKINFLDLDWTGSGTYRLVNSPQNCKNYIVTKIVGLTTTMKVVSIIYLDLIIKNHKLICPSASVHPKKFKIRTK